MRIPLDYYRILGLPTQATPEQVQQAHQDRVVQFPRREYSDPAIAARRELLDEAYSVLADDQARQQYDQGFLQQSSSLSQRLGGDAKSAPQPPSIIVEDPQLIGALLLLQELGEYELVLKLGQEHLIKMKSYNPGVGDAELIAADVALTVALSHLELGREQWQQSHYEQAAEALEAGQDLLLREGIFAGVRSEIRSDLYRLRPYRVLELVSQPLEAATQRNKGLQLLKEMLQERDGVEGQGDDQSGLSVDDFLRFVQQLRDYLTASEQQELFESEARRPSAVASYLAVYALMARGFAEHQPALIRRAKGLLSGLNQRQDVHLEQSVCALMLGQTEEANRALEYSQEYEPLAFIRDQSEGSPDLLPGLCLYAERWLQDEVFQNFRDLKSQQATLKDYFANPQVQQYLESIPAGENAELWNPTQETRTHLGQQRQGGDRSRSLGENSRYGTTATATLDATEANGYSGNTAGLAGTATLGYGSSDEAREAGYDGTTATQTPHRSRRRRTRRRDRASGAPMAGGKLGSIKLGRLLLLVGGGLLALWILLMLLGQILGWILGLGGAPRTADNAQGDGDLAQLEKGQLSIGLGEPVLDIFTPAAEPTTISSTGPLSEEAAQQVIDLWLSTKAEVFGSDRKTELLPNVLTGQALTRWQGEARLSEQDQMEVRYEHRLAIDEVTTSASEPDKATVSATVTELARYYQGGEMTRNREDRDLKVVYNLVRADGSWKIDTMAVQ